MVNKLKVFFKRLLNLLFPEKINCAICGEDNDNIDGYFCSKCLREITFNNKRVCRKCGQPVEVNSGYCFECKSTKWYFSRARAPFIYDGKIRELVLKYKHKKALYLANIMTKYMCDEVVLADFSFDAVCYVPMHFMKAYFKSYNHGLILGKMIAKNFNVPFLKKSIKKVKRTKSQASLDYKQRQNNLIDCFICSQPDLVKGKTILLVDDVFTTGATANECSKILMEAGAKDIVVITFAHTILNNSKKVQQNVDITI